MKDVQDNSKVRLALISTYPGMATIFKHVAENTGFDPYITVATLREAAAIAKNIEPRIDVILSRGGTAEYIKEAVEIPVVAIPVTPFDVMRSIYENQSCMKKCYKKIALFSYKEKMPGIRDIEKMLGLEIDEYTFHLQEDIEAGIQDAKKRGIALVMGGILAIQLAQTYNLESILIECGEEAVYRSMYEAINLAKLRRVERSRAARIKVVLDSVVQGVIATDELGYVTIYNPAAQRIFNIPSEQVLGRKVQDVIPNTQMHKVLESGEVQMAELQDVNGGIIATSRIPIMVGSKRSGVVSTFEDVTKIQYLEQQIRKQMHAKGFIAKYTFKDILTVSPVLIELKEMAALYATTDSSVLIQGESGTGKELFSQSIHCHSRRSSGPFIAVNCAAIPEHLLESELFGYEGGAFTGAKKEGKQGLFELAHKGTIFLDEIGEIPKALQARLLRVLQEKEIMRVGGDKIIPIDIRIISATNKNLEKKMEQGEFREDLYYRLNVFNLQIPPLRERKEDIIVLAMAFLERLSADLDSPAIARELKSALIVYDWPGNIRELYNIMERLSLMISISEKKWSLEKILQKVMYDSVSNPNHDSIAIKVDLDQGLKSAIEQVEKIIIDTMLARCDQKQELAAKKLGIGRTTLWRKGKISDSLKMFQ
ncbi:sigma 54-interacting transcriptional regulator [Pelosinus propionicus]|uniref:Transcriptional regulator containing PAS, AAA-type ATPase, and DNA-binding Fis domains n=1 Tax=Pelosinus propionicus DSM 13327 TaxID=1123291 RepID=A0A1I4I4X0_9FIRM|nr:sigma 54-interacting transcriptional regulator [Pelosinus propionicus]SFL49314.1 Transcriptional regulator containing PAS, AAA-type ATPase, and DNA-binding Fis domains [Pelosinus propionicus DSM 13327]